VLLGDEVRHADDFVVFVIFDHIGLLDYGYEILSMADFTLEPTPDLQNILSVDVTLSWPIQSGEHIRHRATRWNIPYLITR
jgi:hypothetical protein